jgi:hypothetical protein
MDTRDDLPWSEQFRLVSKRWVDLDMAASIMEESKSAFLSQAMLELGDMPVSKAEMRVKGSAAWADYLNSMIKARKEANLAKVKMEWCRMKFMEWQSANANRRAEMRL